MNDQSLVIAVAKLDGWIEEHPNLPQSPIHYRKDFEDKVRVFDDPKHFSSYLTSRDAIIPVICKQHIEVQRDVYRQLFSDRFELDGEGLGVRFTVSLEEIFHKTARDFSIALVKATGKWEE